MSDVDPQTWTATARRYARLRSWHRRSFLGFLACVGLIVLACSPHSPPPAGSRARDILDVVLAAGSAASLLASAVLWHLIRRFRCPRCGQLVAVSTLARWPFRGCIHCRLELIPPRTPRRGIIGTGGSSMPQRFRIRIRTLLVAVAAMAVAMAYVVSYEQAKRSGKREAAEYGIPGLLYVPGRDVVDIRNCDRQDAWAIFYEPLNLIDRKLFGGPSHWAHYCVTRRLSG